MEIARSGELTGEKAQALLQDHWEGAGNPGWYYAFLDHPTPDGVTPAAVFEAAANALEAP